MKRQKLREDETGSKQPASGIQIQSEPSTRKKSVSIGDCNDLDTLQNLLDQPIARGKKQRIRKKIQTLKNPQDPDNEAGKQSTK